MIGAYMFMGGMGLIALVIAAAIWCDWKEEEQKKKWASKETHLR